MQLSLNANSTPNIGQSAKQASSSAKKLTLMGTLILIPEAQTTNGKEPGTLTEPISIPRYDFAIDLVTVFTHYPSLQPDLAVI